VSGLPVQILHPSASQRDHEIEDDQMDCLNVPINGDH
jgi:hypothetical protein